MNPMNVLIAEDNPMNRKLLRIDQCPPEFLRFSGRTFTVRRDSKSCSNCLIIKKSQSVKSFDCASEFLIITNLIRILDRMFKIAPEEHRLELVA